MNSEVCSFSRPSRQRKFLGWAERGSLHRRSHRQGITDTRTHTEPGSNVMMGSVVPPMRTFTSIAQCLTWQKRWSLLAGCDIGKHRAVTVGNSRALFHDIQGACSFHRFVVQTRSQQLCSQQPADQRAPEKVREFTHIRPDMLCCSDLAGPGRSSVSATRAPQNTLLSQGMCILYDPNTQNLAPRGGHFRLPS